jgi:hypothetical protein
MRKRALLSVVPAVVALFLAGCQVAPTDAPPGASPTDTADVARTASSDPPGPATRPTCTLASAAVVKSTLGFTVSEPTESFDESEIECTYRPTNDGHTVIVKFRSDRDAASFAQTRRETDQSGKPTMDVDGLGDEAYATSDEFGEVVTNTLVARKGSVEMLVVAAAPIEAEKAFIGRVFASL